MERLATESCHFYLTDGTPYYSVISKDGTERPVTLRDARKVLAVPSVTEVQKCAARHGLELWKQQQVLLAALTLSKFPGETDQSFCTRIIADSREQAMKAAERGSALHTSIERSLQGKPYEHKEHVRAIFANLDIYGVYLYTGSSEHSFAHPLGFGGKVDWHDKFAVIDFKSKDRIEDGKKLAWDEHCIQLAAYANGLGLPEARLINVFVGIDDKRVLVHEWTQEESKRGWDQFKCLLRFWQLSKNYDCAFELEEC